jgi:hypothetical protein
VGKITASKGFDDMSTDIEPSMTDAVNQVSDQFPGQIHDLSFADLLGLESYAIPGFTELTKDELLGVPLIITGVTWWMSKIRDRVTKEPRDFMSLEAKIGDEDMLLQALKRGWIPNTTSLDELRFSPDEWVVFSDGGTGIRRQVTELCHNEGLIDVGAPDVQDRTRFDRPWQQWERFTESRVQSAEIGKVPCVTKNRNGRQFVMRALRGLSVSAGYSNDYTDDGTTYYLR